MCMNMWRRPTQKQSDLLRPLRKFNFQTVGPLRKLLTPLQTVGPLKQIHSRSAAARRKTRGSRAATACQLYRTRIELWQRWLRAGS